MLDRSACLAAAAAPRFGQADSLQLDACAFYVACALCLCLQSCIPAAASFALGLSVCLPASLLSCLHTSAAAAA